MTRLELFQVMRQLVEAVVPELAGKVILADPDAPAPNGDYCTVDVTSGRQQRGQANVIRSDTAPVNSPIGDVNNVNHDVRPQVVQEVSMNFYGRRRTPGTGTPTDKLNAHDYADRMFQANKRPDVSVLLLQNDVGWRNAGPINKLDALVSQGWESRAQVSIFVMYELTTNATTNAIYSVEVIAENEKGDTLQTVNIEAPTL